MTTVEKKRKNWAKPEVKRLGAILDVAGSPPASAQGPQNKT
jgi:hypothetical protein